MAHGSVMQRRHVVMSGHVAMRPAAARSAPPLRLTRRGRVVVLIFLALIASMASAVLFTTASRAVESPAPAPPTIVVRPGDTLWGIAAREMPRRDGQAAVAELRRLNGLQDYVVHPGKLLILPKAA